MRDHGACVQQLTIIPGSDVIGTVEATREVADSKNILSSKSMDSLEYRAPSRLKRRLFFPCRSQQPAANQSGGFLVWGASSSVGSSVVQITELAGFTVYAVNGPRHNDYSKQLGLSACLKYNDPGVVDSIVEGAKLANQKIDIGYVPSPGIQKVDGGIEAVQEALELQKKGSSGKKLTSCFQFAEAGVKAIHQLEQELGVQIVPGTEVMRDVGSHHFVHAGKSDKVLVPQPSDDPHDPLNWSRAWKFSTIACSLALTFTQAIGPLSLAPMFPELIKAFDSNLNDVIDFTGVAILVLGFSNFIWVPISTSFGRRPANLASTLICFGSAIWRARAKTYGSFMGASVLNGIAAGPAETLGPAVIADIMFLHERGFYQTLYFSFYVGAIMAGPILAGPMSQFSGWRNYWWLNVAMHAATFFACLLGFPETKWDRAQLAKLSSEGSTEAMSPSVEKAVETSDKILHAEHDSSANPGLVENSTTEKDPWLRNGKPGRAQFRLFQANKSPWRSILMDIWIPWKLFAFPIVEFASFVVSWSLSNFLAINLTQTPSLEPPPYGFSPLAVGLSNFALLVGAVIGLSTAGPFSDWVSMKLTNRNRGIREPEMRLPTMIPYVLIMILSNFVVAFGYEYKWNWRAILIIGWAGSGIQTTALPSIVSTYAVDSYKPVAGSLFVSITVNKNLWGYGFSKFIEPWIEKSGYVKPIMTNMCLTTLWCLFGVLFWYKGKTFRVLTKDSKVHSM
ncbi:uncharacterized protein KY384_007106 [Bacidia gigantensis]|uniref:uncharacterized protein n=1 Tax=Bacidia gigantensis TaxID=2732470 RepID=UPI001D03DA3A|nr:uncharacterized protein KY384_007106 [Bacidia gigantensis]KAG8528189.1 hypothetical protein KY384_007106 [Bacidia gigantensis]